MEETIDQHAKALMNINDKTGLIVPVTRIVSKARRKLKSKNNEMEQLKVILGYVQRCFSTDPSLDPVYFQIDNMVKLI